MKLCKNCALAEGIFLQNGPNFEKVLICTHSECRGPVIGEPLPCNHARGHRDYCSIKGKYYRPRPADDFDVTKPKQQTRLVVPDEVAEGKEYAEVVEEAKKESSVIEVSK